MDGSISGYVEAAMRDGGVERRDAPDQIRASIAGLSPGTWALAGNAPSPSPSAVAPSISRRVQSLMAYASPRDDSRPTCYAATSSGRRPENAEDH